jgi:hypothetical protein
MEERCGADNFVGSMLSIVKQMAEATYRWKGFMMFICEKEVKFSKEVEWFFAPHTKSKFRILALLTGNVTSNLMYPAPRYKSLLDFPHLFSYGNRKQE